MVKYLYSECDYRFITDPDMSLLHVDSVRKQIGGRQILNDVFLSCRQGEIVGLLGRNGSGKSTLLKIIFGSLSADHKYVTIDGRVKRSLADTRNLIRYLPQDSFLPGHIRIKTIISCFCNQVHAAVIRDHELIRPFLAKKANQLSGGEKRILEILLMIYSDARYLLLDEPFNGIAPLHIELIKGLIRKHGQHKGFIITDHDYSNVLDISETIILIQDGNTRKINDLQELIDYGYLPEKSTSWSLQFFSER